MEIAPLLLCFGFRPILLEDDSSRRNDLANAANSCSSIALHFLLLSVLLLSSRWLLLVVSEKNEDEAEKDVEVKSGWIWTFSNEASCSSMVAAALSMCRLSLILDNLVRFFLFYSIHISFFTKKKRKHTMLTICRIISFCQITNIFLMNMIAYVLRRLGYSLQVTSESKDLAFLSHCPEMIDYHMKRHF